MGSWMDDEDMQGNYLSCKEGETLRVKVKSIVKVADKYSKFNYKRKDGTFFLTKDTQEPFHHVLTSVDGKELTIGSISLMSALKTAKVDAGMEIIIKHPGRGKYSVEVVGGKPKEPEIDIEDLGKDTPF